MMRANMRCPEPTVERLRRRIADEDCQFRWRAAHDLRIYSRMLVGSIKFETEFVMHSFDEWRVEDARLKGHKLVEEIRRRFPTSSKSRR